MTARGYERDFAERCFKQIEGFGEYGFPESHAASFALLVYVSAWLKRHYPAAFACALLNSQPMGFYAPAQIVRDAREHGIEVRPVDVNLSEWDCTLEPAEAEGGVALRLGLRQIKGFKEEAAGRLVAARGNGYRDVHELWRRAGLAPAALERLAHADAWGSLGLSRRQAQWAVRALEPEPLPLFAGQLDDAVSEAPVALPAMALGEHVVEDYTALRLSLKAPPLALLRARIVGADPAFARLVPAARLADLPNDGRVTVAGLVLVRQRPGSASGVIFVTLEDESGVANLVVWPQVFERHRRTVLRARLMAVRGKLQRQGIVIHVVAERLYDLSPQLASLAECDAGRGSVSGTALARADAVKRPGRDPGAAQKRLFSSRDFH